MKNDELTVRTPLGELVVGIKADPDYPGISVAFCGNGMNDCFNEGSIRLAWIEYSPEKRRLQAIVNRYILTDIFRFLLSRMCRPTYLIRFVRFVNSPFLTQQFFQSEKIFVRNHIGYWYTLLQLMSMPSCPEFQTVSHRRYNARFRPTSHNENYPV